MQTTTSIFLQFPTLPPRPLLKNFGGNKIAPHQRKRPPNCITALKRDGYGKDRQNGGLVDDNMIVLRMRIHEMKMLERNDEAPVDWMEWEKRWYLSYDSDICEAVGCLQNVLMEIRPSLVLAMVALLMLSVPTSFAFVFHHLMDLVR